MSKYFFTFLSKIYALCLKISGVSKNSDGENSLKITIISKNCRLKITAISKNYRLKIPVRACMYARVCAYIWQIAIRTHDRNTTTGKREEHQQTQK